MKKKGKNSSMAERIPHSVLALNTEFLSRLNIYQRLNSLHGALKSVVPSEDIISLQRTPGMYIRPRGTAGSDAAV
jgi:hypothetical protein